MFRELDSRLKVKLTESDGDYENPTNSFIQQRKGVSAGDNADALAIAINSGGGNASRIHIGYPDRRQ